MHSQLATRLTEGFEGGISALKWESVVGGEVGLGCGALHPYAHGKNLYFNGCYLRHAVTNAIDTTKAT